MFVAATSGVVPMPNEDMWTRVAASLKRRLGKTLRSEVGWESASDRRLYLPRVLAIGPEDIDDPSEQAARRVVLRLASALRAERTRGRAGHWTYDLSRHLALMQAYKAERRRLVQLAGARRVGKE